MKSPLKLGILVTHPIQYYAPLFRELAKRTDVDLHVFYCSQATPEEQSAAGFGVAFDWDVSLLDGYRHTFLENVAARPSTAGFWGMDVPGIAHWVGGGELDALLIVGWHFKGAWQAMAACWRHRVSVLLRSDSQLLTPRSPLVSAAKRLVYPQFVRRVDGCLAAGQRAQKYFLHYGASPNRVFVVPHAVDDERIFAEAGRLAGDRQDIRASWQVEPEQIAWMFAGKFTERKRPLDFVRTIAELNRKDGKSVGIMVGDGPLRGVCEQYARDRQAPIRFAGFLNQSEITRAYVASEALVLPSDGGETWGLVVNEAMVCGLPCFVSDRVGCGPDLIAEGVTGAIFPVGDPAEAARKLQMYANHEILIRMGARAQSRADRFSVKTVGGSLVEAVTAAVGRSQVVSASARVPLVDQRPTVQQGGHTGA